MENELKIKITTDVSDLNKGTSEANSTLNKFGKEAESTAKKTDKLKDNTDQLGKKIKGLGSDTADTTEALGDMAEGLGEGGILGISTVIIGTLTLLIAKVQQVQQEFGALAVAQSKAVGSAQAEISVLNSLIDVANDTNRSMRERQSALNQINSEYGDYLGNLTLEELQTEGVKDAVDSLTQSLIRQAKIKGAQDLIAKESAELFKLIEQGPIGAADSVDILQAAFLSAGSASSFTTNLIKQGLDTQGQAVEETEKKIASYNKTLQALIGEDIALGGTFTGEGDKEARKAAEKAAREAAALAEKSAKERDAIYKKSVANYEKAIKSIDSDLDKFLLENALEDGFQAAEVYEQSGARIKAALKEIEEDPLDFGVEEAFLKIQKLEGILARLKSQVSGEQFEIISTYNLEQLTAFESKLKATQTVADAFTSGVAAGFSTLSSQIAGSLQTGNSLLDAFVASFISSLGQVASAMLQQAILDKVFSTAKLATNVTQSNANAITVATSAAAALGPLGAVALPELIASQLAIVNGAFAAIPKFASGGVVGGGAFNGDTIPALLNSGEMVLNARQQSNLFSQLNKSGASATSNRDAVQIEGVIRGQDILLSNKRAERNNNRFSR